MAENMGSFLRELRTARRLTTTELAARAGLSRVTLSHWQKGKRQPRLPELEAALNALEATEVQRRKARELLRTPANLLRLRQEAEARQPELTEVAGGVAHSGDLLRAMRRRKGWTQAELARAMNVTQATLSRWEKAECWPDAATLHTLCYLLGAQEDELTTLTVGRFSLGDGQTALTEEAIREGITAYQTTWNSPSAYGLAELHLLNLIAHARSLAGQHPSGRRLLARVYAEYTDYLFMERRFEECREAANRALDIYAAARWRDEITDRVAIRLAEALTQRGSQQGLDNATSLLRQWLPGTTHPAYIGWMLRDLAQFKAARGEMEEAISLGWEALRRTEEGPAPSEYLHRRHDLARLLVQANRAQEALEVMEASNRHPFFMLAQAETYHGIGETAAAHQLITEVAATLEKPVLVITLPELAFYRPVVETFTEQIERAGKGGFQQREQQ